MAYPRSRDVTAANRGLQGARCRLDGRSEPVPGAIDDPAREPVRATVGGRRNHDAVSVKELERILDGEQRIGVRDESLGFDSRDAQGVEGRRKPLLGVTPRTPVVAGPEPEPRIQGGSDYENIGVSIDVRADHVACDCLVRNHEQSACDVSGQRSSFHSLMLRTLVVARESGLCRGCECGKSSCVFPPPETRAILRA